MNGRRHLVVECRAARNEATCLSMSWRSSGNSESSQVDVRERCAALWEPMVTSGTTRLPAGSLGGCRSAQVPLARDRGQRHADRRVLNRLEQRHGLARVATIGKPAPGAKIGLNVSWFDERHRRLRLVLPKGGVMLGLRTADRPGGSTNRDRRVPVPRADGRGPCGAKAAARGRNGTALPLAWYEAPSPHIAALARRRRVE